MSWRSECKHRCAVDLLRERLRVGLLDRVLVAHESGQLLAHRLRIVLREQPVELREAMERRLHRIEAPTQIEVAAQYGGERCTHAVTAIRL